MCCDAMMCVSNGCLWNLRWEGGGVALFWEGHEITRRLVGNLDMFDASTERILQQCLAQRAISLSWGTPQMRHFGDSSCLGCL